MGTMFHGIAAHRHPRQGVAAKPNDSVPWTHGGWGGEGMMKPKAFAWTALASVALASVLAGSAASAQDKTLKIGILTDMTNVSADIMGAGSVLAAQMAVEDAGGPVAGMKVEVLSGDHQQKP